MKTILLSLSMLFLLSACKKEDAEDPGNQTVFHNRAVGASANEFLSDVKYQSLRIQIQYMPGFDPDPGALAHLQNFLVTNLKKPGGITIETSAVAAASSTSLNSNDIINIEKQNRSVFSTSDQMTIYVLYTNGNYTTGNVLGIAYRNTSTALFGKTIRDNSGGIGQTSRTKLEATVLEHEVGHLLGLVDIGSPMQTPHKDAAHGNHCDNSNCLMYFASETTDILGFLITGNIPALDANCKNDLVANGG